MATWITLKNGVHLDLDNLSKSDQIKFFGSEQEFQKAKEHAKVNEYIRSKGKVEKVNISSNNSNNNKFKPESPKQFKNKLSAAKATCDPRKAWRVDDYSHTEADYAKCSLYSSPGGSVVAVTSSGDIISVCKNAEDRETKGKDLIAIAVKNGGVKLDSFSGNHVFYDKCGFEPVSWCEFDEQYAPEGWEKGVDDAEPIIFYKYTGKSGKYADVNDFLSKVAASSDYDAAKNTRDNSLK